MGAHHVPRALDVDELWSPLPGDGYLVFMRPEAPIRLAPLPRTRALGIAGIYREEHTGYTTAAGAGVLDHPYDNDDVAGDRADFDWVQENRPDEVGRAPGGSNHPGPGAMAWTIGAPARSRHESGGAAHEHSQAEAPPGPLPELAGEGFGGESFDVVDVFPAIVEGQDRDPGGPRERALDYELWFVDLARGVSSHGVPVRVFARGWTEAATSDDYVARWRPVVPGNWNAVVIDPPFGPGHDEIVEIDAVRAAKTPALIARPASP